MVMYRYPQTQIYHCWNHGWDRKQTQPVEAIPTFGSMTHPVQHPPYDAENENASLFGKWLMSNNG